MMATVANQPRTPHHSVRVENELWDRARTKAIAEGSNMSQKIREWLVEYVEDDSD